MGKLPTDEKNLKDQNTPEVIFGEESDGVRFKKEVSFFAGVFRHFCDTTVGTAKRAASKITQTVLDAADDLQIDKADYVQKRRSIVCVLSIFVFFLIASSAVFPLNSYPLGIAALSSVGAIYKKRFAVTPRITMSVAFAAVLASCLFTVGEGIIYFVSFIMVFALRTLLTRGEYNESLIMRVVVGACGGLAAGILQCIFYRFTLESFASCLVIVFCSVLFTYLFSGLFLPVRDGISLPASVMRFESGVAAVGFTFLFALRQVTFFGFSPTVIIGIVAVFTLSKNKGVFYGIAGGLAAGLACTDYVWVPIMAMSGFFGGMFFSYSSIMAVGISFLVSMGFAVSALGASAFMVVPDYMMAIIVLYCFIRYVPEKDEHISKGSFVGTAAGVENMKKTKTKLSKMSDAFSSLAEVFYALSDHTSKPRLSQTREMIKKSCDKVCSRCSMSSLCWGRDYTMMDVIVEKISETLNEKRKLTCEDIPEHFRNKCARFITLLDEINKSYSAFCDDFSEKDKTYILAGEYNTVSKLFKNTAEEWNENLTRNLEVEKTAKRALRRLSLPSRALCAYGERDTVVDVYGISPDKVAACADEVSDAFMKECGMRFASPEFIMLSDTAMMRMKRCRTVDIECARASRAKKGEKVNGDSITFFENDDHYFYSLICDGMGSGRDAALTSRLASLFVEKIMTCGGPKGIALELLNSFLIARHDECFTTVDMVEIDLLTKEASFIKAGAAPSYIVRGSQIYKINSSTPPAGIIYSITAEQTKVELCEKDVIVMISDGVGENSGVENEAWIMELLALEMEERPADMAQKILDRAEERAVRSDDMTVAVVKILGK